MPRNGSGTYSLPSGNPVTSGTVISSTVQNNTMSDVATALTQSLAVDGQSVPTANLPMAGFRHTNVGNGVSATDYASFGQLTTTNNNVTALGLPVGQCKLVKSGSNLLLKPVNGNRLTINGAPQAIPSAGVTLAPTGLTVSTLYYIYAYMNAGVMTLEASTTGHSTDTTTGVEIKTGDATRTLVGMVRPITGPAFQDTQGQRFVRSWFNENGIANSAILTSDQSTTSTSYVELSTTIRNEFLLWAGEQIHSRLTGTAFNSLAGGRNVTSISVDGTVLSNLGIAIIINTATTTIPFAVEGLSSSLSEGYHYATMVGLVNTGTGSWSGNATTICVLNSNSYR